MDDVEVEKRVQKEAKYEQDLILEEEEDGRANAEQKQKMTDCTIAFEILKKK